MLELDIELNGVKKHISSEPQVRLLDVLRNDFRPYGYQRRVRRGRVWRLFHYFK